MDSDWAGLLGFLLTLPLNVLVVTLGLLPAVAGRYGYDVPVNVTDYHFEYGFIVCAVLNALILYPFYLLWIHRKQSEVFKLPPPNINLQPMTRKQTPHDVESGRA